MNDMGIDQTYHGTGPMKRKEETLCHYSPYLRYCSPCGSLPKGMLSLGWPGYIVALYGSILRDECGDVEQL